MANDDFYRDPRVAAAYDAEQASRPITTDDLAFYVDLAREAAAAGEGVLELGCGTGRVTLPIAAAGVSVVGLDSSPAMLDVARTKTPVGSSVRWVEADMRSLELGERFGLVVIPFRSFLMLLTVADQLACLDRVRAHLLPGGRLAFNVFNPDPAVIAAWRGDHRGSLERLDANEGDSSGRTVHWQTNVYDTARQELDHTRLVEELSDEGAVISRVYRNLRLRYVFRYEIEHLLARADFTVEALYGWFDRRPFTDTSDEMVWLARRG
jgi:SAM-dependent methyltransferase